MKSETNFVPNWRRMFISYNIDCLTTSTLVKKKQSETTNTTEMQSSISRKIDSSSDMIKSYI